MGFLGESQECAYKLNDTFSRRLYDTLIHKNNLFANRGHFQLLEVNSRTFQPKKCIFTADIGHCLVDGFENGYYFGNNYKGQFTVSRCTETPLRQDITLLYETK